MPWGESISPHIERNGGLANLYPSAHERELERSLRAKEAEAARAVAVIEMVAEALAGHVLVGPCRDAYEAAADFLRSVASYSLGTTAEQRPASRPPAHSRGVRQ